MTRDKINRRSPLWRGGQLTIQMLVFGAVAVIVMGSFITWSNIVLHNTARNANRIQAFSIAEAGIEYYRWHLAHAPTDFRDGTGIAGLYVHDYKDKNGVVIGQFVLDITPPSANNNIVTIASTGKFLNDPTADRTIKVKMGIQSYTKYAVLVNDSVNFLPGTEVWGLVHSNNGVRFDGIAHNLVESSLQTYDDPDHSGVYEYAVHTHVLPVDPLPTSTLPSRSDIFYAGRQMGLPTVDFTKITQNLAQIKTSAQASGIYRASSTALGYDVNLKTDNTLDLYKVTGLAAAPQGCVNHKHEPGWSTWSVGTEVFLGNYAVSTSGLVFLEDNVWVRGEINNSRLTIAAARFPDNPSTRANIIINDNVRYTNYNGSDVIGLIAQNNINVGLYSQDVLRIDAVLMAQNGRVHRYEYQPPGETGNSRCSPYHARTSITTFGMIASYGAYGFAYTNSSGYQSRSLNYDNNLLYNPPPSFPLTSDQYSLISWEEQK